MVQLEGGNRLQHGASLGSGPLDKTTQEGGEMGGRGLPHKHNGAVLISSSAIRPGEGSTVGGVCPGLEPAPSCWWACAGSEGRDTGMWGCGAGPLTQGGESLPTLSSFSAA